MTSTAESSEGLEPNRLDRPRWWLTALVALFVAGLILRLLFAVLWATPLGMTPGDERFYEYSGQSIADGKGYVDTLMGASGATAAHPPVFSAVIAGLDLMGLSPDGHDGSVEPLRIGLAVICSLVIPLMAMLGRRLAGPAVGLLAGGIAAFHPLWVQNGPNLWPEGVYLIVVTGILLLAVRTIDQPSLGRAAALGAAIGLAALTRSEGLAFLLLVGVPVVLVAAQGWRQRGRLALAVTLIALAVVAPWLVRNYRLVHTLTFSTQDGITVAGSNCDSTYYGEHLGGFDFKCSFGYTLLADGTYGKTDNPSVESSHLERVALDYVRAHQSRLPTVIGARVLRTWSLYRTGDQLAWDVGERRNRTFQTVGQYVEWVLLAAAVIGAIRLPRRAWRRWIVIAAGPILITVLAIVLYGGVRLRVAAEPSVALFASYGVVATVPSLRRHLRNPADETLTSQPA